MVTQQSSYQIDDEDFELVRGIVYKHCGICLSVDKKAMVQARVTKQMRGSGFTNARGYLRRVNADRGGRMFEEFINAISTNLTSFFRENEHFDYLTRVALPPLLARKQSTGDGRILAWSAACSTGEEPYSIGMTVLSAMDEIRPPATRPELRILATDISTKVLALAQTGAYEESRLSNVPAMYRNKYFIDAGASGAQPGQSVATAELRKAIRFRHLNLLGPWPFKGPFDFIFCRNVMIYFDRPTQQTLIDRIWSCLNPGGILFTGHSESLTRIVHRFANRLPSIYEKV